MLCEWSNDTCTILIRPEPDPEPENQPPVANAGPDLKALANPQLDRKKLPFDPLEYVEHLDQLPFDPNMDPGVGD